MSFTTAQLEKLEAAIASGVRIVRYGDKTVEYHSLDQMISLRDRMQAQLEPEGASSRTSYAAFERD